MTFKLRLWCTVAALMVLASAPDASAQAVPEPGAKKVLLIGVDGVRADVLMDVNTPNIDRLIANGTFSDQAQTRMPTVSGPGWSSMLIGVWSDKHGVRDNTFEGKNYRAYPDFLTRLEQINPEFSTFSVSDWPPLGGSVGNGPLVSDTVDVKVLINGDVIGYAEADARSVSQAEYYLAHEDPDAAFVYLGNPDVVAHEVGAMTPAYRSALEQVDHQVGRLLEAIQSRPTYAEEDWLILMSTDHGHRDQGGHGGSSPVELRIFFLASGPSAMKGRPVQTPGIVDVAVTALTHLGVAIDPAWNLDGRAVGLK